MAFAVQNCSTWAAPGTWFSATLGQSLPHTATVLGGSLLCNIARMPTKPCPSTAEQEPYWCLWCYRELWAALHCHFPPHLPLPPHSHW